MCVYIFFGGPCIYDILGTGFFIDIKSFRSHYGPGVDSASNRKEYQGYFLGVKAAGACTSYMIYIVPSPVSVLSKAWVFGRSNAGIAGLNLDGVMDVLSLVSVVFCQVEVSATDRSFVQRSPTECGVSEYDLDTSKMRRPSPTGAAEFWL